MKEVVTGLVVALRCLVMEPNPMPPEHRLVHLDLKGAPPKISYYEWLFPMLHKWGATGLLVEYEDMFPYEGGLKDIASQNAYSSSEVKALQLLAKQNELTFIPLIQTFGHFEFVLKQDRFKHLREVENCPMTLCPVHKGSLNLVKQMIEQVVRLHPDITWFHIGADEVFHVGLCEKCIEHMNATNVLPVDLFLTHVRHVLEYVRTHHSSLRAIMWDDMFRAVDLPTLQGSGIGSLVEPMVWYYQATFNLPPDIWTRYAQVFDGLWAASAFKGATGPCAMVTDIGYHVENHKEWLNVVNLCVRPVVKKFHGYALTGWQRYDHFSILCELLPVGLPSLAVCLLTFTAGAFTLGVHERASKDLQFPDLMPLSPFKCLENDQLTQCQFAGHEVFTGVHTLLRLKAEYKFFIKNDRLKGWMTSWHVRNNFTNPVHLNHFLPHGQRLLLGLAQLKATFETELPKIFYDDMVEEWIAVNIDPMIDKLTTIVDTATRQIQLGGRSRSRCDDPVGAGDSMDSS